jgi:tetratricopeptide (TPR) repeat protein
MFGRLAAVRIKAAEDALTKGRLDEAFEMASAPDLAGNSRVGRLLRELAEPLLQRGQDHLLSKRFTEALADFERVARCGYRPKKVEEWRKRAVEAMADDRKAEHERQAVLAAARERLDAGSLGGAADALARAPKDDSERQALSAEISRRTQKAKETLAAAKRALKGDRLSEAVERFRAAKALYSQLDGVGEMENALINRAVKQAVDDFKDGRLQRAGQGFAALGEVGRGRPERVEMEEALRLARDAAKALTEDRYTRAGVLLGRLAQIGPKAGWISEVRKHLNVLEEHRRALLEGPLGLALGREVPSAIGVSARRAGGRGRGAASPGERAPRGDETVAAVARPGVGAARAGPGQRLSKRLLLRIDGVGSFLLLRGDRISIGRSGPGATASLQLISDLSDRQAEIIRAGEDYFVVARSGVELAGRRVDHALLQDGDRIRLGKRVRLEFLRPSLKSVTATLDLGDGVRTTSDCWRVILWSGPLLMGSTRDCHVRLRAGMGGAILMERGGELFIKPMGPGGQAVPIVPGVQTELGDLRLSVQAWSDRTGGGKVVG